MNDYKRLKPEDRDIGKEEDDNITKAEFRKLYGYDHEYVAKVFKKCFGLECGSASICHAQLGLIKPNELFKAMRRYDRYVKSDS